MERYSKITKKKPREIVLLKAFPCAWGKCSFCDYIEDNSKNLEEILKINEEILLNITGEFRVLEVINSGSCFELPKETLNLIRDIVKDKNIERLMFESHWIYRSKLEQMKEFMGVPIIFKIGVETFDNDFREKTLNKHADFKRPEQVSKYFDSPCIMVGIKGQTKEMIDNDISILKKYFKAGTINVYTNNTTNIKRDDDLVNWFMEKYKNLENDHSIEVLYVNTDFGVGD